MTPWKAGMLPASGSKPGLTGWKRFAVHLALAGAAVGVFGLVVWLAFDNVIMPRVVGQGKDLVSVPSVEGKTLDEARATLLAQGLEPVLDPELKRSERVEKGLVALQSPISGYKVKAGHSVRIWTSAGKTSFAVPDVKGQDSAKAARLIEETGLGLDEADHQLDSSVAAGKVIRTNPTSGASLAPGAKVRLVISLGNDTTTAPSDTTKARRLF
jgi:eukaryotic-like serine/threonine-protein kinase